MEATHKETGKITREVEFTLTSQEFEPYRKSETAEVQKTAKIKGFREGKVPPNMVQKLYKTQINEQAAEKAVQEAFEKYVEENDLNPFGTPKVEKLDFGQDGSLSFTVEYEVLPEFELQDYKGLSAKKVYHVVTPEEIDEQIEEVRQRESKEEIVDEITDENHVIKADFQKLDESGAPLIGEGSKDIPIHLANEQVNDDLKKKLIGARMDDRVRVELPVGEDEQNVPYEIHIKEIRQIVLPEIDDEFAQRITGEDEETVEDLRDRIKVELEREYDRRYTSMYRDDLVSQLIAKHEFEVPSSLVMMILRDRLENLKRRYKDEKLPENFDYNRFYQEVKPEAEHIARWALVRDKVVEAEGITVSEEDYEALAAADAPRVGIDSQKLLEYYRGQEEVESRIQAEKVLQLLVDYSDVEEEIEDLELRKRQEEEAASSSEEAESTAESAEAEDDDESSEETEPEMSEAKSE